MAKRFTTMTYLAQNANTTTTTTGLDISENTAVTMQIVADTGAHATHIVDLQCSTNDSNWHNITSGSVTGIGIVGVTGIGAQYVRARVSTNEGGASTVNIIIQAK